MRASLIVLGLAVVAVVTVKVLGSTLKPPVYEKVDLGLVEGLAMNQVSKSQETRQVWREPRRSHSAADRAELNVGELRPGDVFRVTNHARKGSTVWVEIGAQDRPGLRGWVASPADDPFRAVPVRTQAGR